MSVWSNHPILHDPASQSPYSARPHLPISPGVALPATHTHADHLRRRLRPSSQPPGRPKEDSPPSLHAESRSKCEDMCGRPKSHSGGAWWVGTIGMFAPVHVVA
jgi:hypothetical protein